MVVIKYIVLKINLYKHKLINNSNIIVQDVDIQIMFKKWEIATNKHYYKEF